MYCCCDRLLKALGAAMADGGNYPLLGAFDFLDKPPVHYSPLWIEKATAIPSDVLKHSVRLDAFDSALSEALVDGLGRAGITHLFPVQHLLIPELLAVARCSLPPRDICVSAPTGSGKTLAYVLPTLHVLQTAMAGGRRKRRVRALVVVPVVDLARQVHRVFSSLVDDRAPLKIVLLTGQQDIEAEISQLYEVEEGGLVASADLVIATPGRLVEHLSQSGGAFSLRYLRFLIIDEADRLLSDYRIDWFKAVDAAVYGGAEEEGTGTNRVGWFFGEKRSIGCDPLVRRHRPNVGSVRALFAAGRYPLQKIFLSATLSYNPGQLQRLNLFRPKLFRAREEEIEGQPTTLDDGVVLPSELKEHCVTCSSKSKPLVIFNLLKEHQSDWDRVLCFVQSRQASRRLAVLLTQLGLDGVREASAGLTRTRREKLLRGMGTGKIRVLISSDLLARGIDIPLVTCVINYDPPKQLLAYVHRAGRTARAGCRGTVVTVASHQEVDEFKNLMQAANRWSAISPLEAVHAQTKEMKEKYRDALAQLKTQVLQIQKRKIRTRRRPKKSAMNRSAATTS